MPPFYLFVVSLFVSLSLQLLLSVECLSQLEVELGLVLTAARRFTDLCLPERGCGEEEGRGEGGREEGARKHFVEMLTEVFLAMMRDPQQFTKFQQLSETSDSTAESLTSILGTEYQFDRGSAPNCECLYFNDTLVIFSYTCTEGGASAELRNGQSNMCIYYATKLCGVQGVKL